MQDELSRLEEIFSQAVAMATPEERAEYLGRACDQAKLRQRIEHLLAAHDAASGFLQIPKSDAATASGLLTERVGATIGRYKLLQQIGEGGFGAVFMAEQEHPVRRRVALKIIKLGMDTKQVIARFEAERQALAMMDHPNVARVFDAGATENGRPYFVMELVKGIPITEYCDHQKLNLAHRLELFTQVCHAVQHAHQKGLIHRDIKPGNILVSTQDNRPLAKVIDFGIAKATQARLTEKTLFTEFRQLIGTPEYMSPEQAEGTFDIDTRSDVYSLGVLLYELLTGATPFDARELRSKAYAEIQRIIREVDPPKPSTRLSTLEALPSVAAHRSIEPRRLTASVRGELDWIVMKCLEKDRTRRYDSASSLAADILHHLSDETVSAAAPSQVYRVRKFVRRNKGPVIGVACVLFMLVAGICGTSWGLLRERQATRRALLAAEAEKKASEISRAREAETRAVLDFVQDKVFAAARPKGQGGGLGHDVTLRQAIEAALPFVEKGFADQPLIEARLRMSMGRSFIFLGDPRIAAAQYEAARALYRQSLGPHHRDTLASQSNLAASYDQLGRRAEALALREETLALTTAHLGADNPLTFTAMGALANSYLTFGRYTEALALYEKTLALMRAKLAADHPDVLLAMNNLANSHDYLGHPLEALKLREETLELRKTKLGPEHPDTLQSMYNLAGSYSDLQRHAEAIELRERTLVLSRVKLGADHPFTLACMHALATDYGAAGRHADAIKLHEQTLALRQAKLGPDHADTAASMHSLGNSYFSAGRKDDALRLRERTLELMKSAMGPDHPDTLRAMANLASSYSFAGKFTDALALREEALALRKTKLGADHPDTLVSMAQLAESYFRQNRNDDAMRIVEDCLPRAAGKAVHKTLFPTLLEIRLRVLEEKGDASGCLETADKWEALKRTDAESLYLAASMRATCAAVVRQTDKSPAGQAKAEEQADVAMAWLRQCVAAGYKDVNKIKANADLDSLRGRDDFTSLITELQRQNRQPSSTSRSP